MPSQEALRRERDVVQLVMASLRSASGLNVELLGSPDEERDSGRFPPGLTVDALLRLSDDRGDCTWAVDVMNLSWNPRLVPAIRAFEDRLVAELQRLAREHQVGLSVMYRPPVGQEDRGAGYLEQLVAFARQTIESGDVDPHQSMHPLAVDPGTAVLVDRRPTEPGEIHVSAGLTDTADVGAQLEGTLVPPLENKLTKQLLRAHEHGHPTLLAIDQVGPPSEVGNNFIASPSAVGQLVSRTVARHGHGGGAHSLDVAVLVTRDGCAPVYGSWPTTPSP